jgi:hypothetical protein
VSRKPFWLTDQEWSRIEPHLPADVRGKARVDDRRVISGIVQSAPRLAFARHFFLPNAATARIVTIFPARPISFSLDRLSTNNALVDAEENLLPTNSSFTTANGATCP